MSHPDYLHVFTGIPTHQLVGWVRPLLGARHEVESKLLALLTDNPLEANAAFLVASAAAFYQAERHANPKVETFVDALYYVSTCLAVGYADIFPQTQTGKAIATLVMTFGPALTAELLDTPQQAQGASQVGQDQMIAKLDAILVELQHQREARVAAS